MRPGLRRGGTVGDERHSYSNGYRLSCLLSEFVLDPFDPAEEVHMTEFEEFVRKEREELSRRRNELINQKKDLDRQLQDIEREFAAVEAYERAKKGGGKAPAASKGGRRTGVRQEVLEVIKRNQGGIKRADILEEMGAKGNKRAEQSISNALSNLKKQAHITLEDGAYRPAA